VLIPTAWYDGSLPRKPEPRSYRPERFEAPTDPRSRAQPRNSAGQRARGSFSDLGILEHVGRILSGPGSSWENKGGICLQRDGLLSGHTRNVRLESVSNRHNHLLAAISLPIAGTSSRYRRPFVARFNAIFCRERVAGLSEGVLLGAIGAPVLRVGVCPADLSLHHRGSSVRGLWDTDRGLDCFNGAVEGELMARDLQGTSFVRCVTRCRVCPLCLRSVVDEVGNVATATGCR
jgi:hypothetical protein